MKTLWLLAIAITSSTFLVGPAAAHHSFAAEFDRNLPVTVTGTVTKVEWMNPHARFYLDAKNEAGETVNWDFELASPNGLMRIGWTRKSLSAGDQITVDGFLARDGSHRVNTRSVTRADGTKMFSGDRTQGGLQ